MADRLADRRILVTRSPSQSAELSRLVENCGGSVYVYPLIDTVAACDPQEKKQLDQVCRHLDHYDWIWFTSANAVQYFFAELQSRAIGSEPLKKAKIAAVGPRTAQLLQERQVHVEDLPPQSHARAMVSYFASKLRAGQRLLLPRGNLARSELPLTLREAGVIVDDCVVYHTVKTTKTRSEKAELINAFKQHTIDAVTLTSPSIVEALLSTLAELGDDPLQLLDSIPLVCVGPVTAQRAKCLGLSSVFTADQASMKAIVETLNCILV